MPCQFLDCKFFLTCIFERIGIDLILERLSEGFSIKKKNHYKNQCMKDTPNASMKFIYLFKVEVIVLPVRGNLRELSQAYIDSFAPRDGDQSKVPDFVEV